MEAEGLDAPVVATAPASGVPVVVKSGGASLYDRPNGAVVRPVETGTIAQALSRTPTGDWIFVEVEAGVQGWLASSALVSVNPASLPVYGRPQAEQSNQPTGGNRQAQPAQPTSTPVEEPSPTPEPTATATATAIPTATPTVTALPPTATTLPTATATATAIVAAIPPAQPFPSPIVQPATVSRPVLVSSTDSLLRTVGVVRSGGAFLATEPSGGTGLALPAGEILTLLQRSADDSWLEVARTDGSTGWVARSALLTAGISKLPRVGEAAAPAPVSDLSAGEVAPAAAPSVAQEDAPVLATVRTDGSRLNVRSGPGADFPVVAKADNGVSYRAVGVDAQAEWVQIEISDAPDGTGWVSAGFVLLD